jgi:beta-N-acetylglucosaminidase
VYRQWSAVPLRKEAVEALQKSTTMFKQAVILLKQGRREAAKKLQNEARAKRNDSVWLMAKANELEKASHSH